MSLYDKMAQLMSKGSVAEQECVEEQSAGGWREAGIQCEESTGGEREACSAMATESGTGVPGA